MKCNERDNVLFNDCCMDLTPCKGLRSAKLLETTDAPADTQQEADAAEVTDALIADSVSTHTAMHQPVLFINAASIS